MVNRPYLYSAFLVFLTTQSTFTLLSHSPNHTVHFSTLVMRTTHLHIHALMKHTSGAILGFSILPKNTLTSGWWATSSWWGTSLPTEPKLPINMGRKTKLMTYHGLSLNSLYCYLLHPYPVPNERSFTSARNIPALIYFLERGGGKMMSINKINIACYSIALLKYLHPRYTYRKPLFYQNRANTAFNSIKSKWIFN